MKPDFGHNVKNQQNQYISIASEFYIFSEA